MKVAPTSTNGKLLIVLIVLAVIAGYPWWKQYISRDGAVDTPFDFSDITAKSVDEIIVRDSGEEKIRLVKEWEDAWKVNGSDASSDKVNSLFESVASAHVEALVGKNPENHERFGVDDGLSVSFKRGEETVTYIIGDTNSSSGSFYIREEGSDDVYQMSGSLVSQLSLDESSWHKEEKTDSQNNDS